MSLQIPTLSGFAMPLKICLILYGLSTVPSKDENYAKKKRLHGIAMKILFTLSCLEGALHFAGKVLWCVHIPLYINHVRQMPLYYNYYPIDSTKISYKNVQMNKWVRMSSTYKSVLLTPTSQSRQSRLSSVKVLLGLGKYFILILLNLLAWWRLVSLVHHRHFQFSSFFGFLVCHPLLLF